MYPCHLKSDISWGWDGSEGHCVYVGGAYIRGGWGCCMALSVSLSLIWGATPNFVLSLSTQQITGSCPLLGQSKYPPMYPVHPLHAPIFTQCRRPDLALPLCVMHAEPCHSLCCTLLILFNNPLLRPSSFIKLTTHTI